jgi:hypothetical protein
MFNTHEAPKISGYKTSGRVDAKTILPYCILLDSSFGNYNTRGMVIQYPRRGVSVLGNALLIRKAAWKNGRQIV